jgi:hypothetical protein
MTSLPVHSGRPEVEPWLSGWIEEEEQTRVVWRRLLPARPDDDDKTRKKTLSDFFQYAPPHISETLESLTRDVVDTLQKRAKVLAANGQRGAEGEIPTIGAVILSRRGEVDEVLGFRCPG